jgi:hypothetical protein
MRDFNAEQRGRIVASGGVSGDGVHQWEDASARSPRKETLPRGAA